MAPGMGDHSRVDAFCPAVCLSEHVRGLRGRERCFPEKSHPNQSETAGLSDLLQNPIPNSNLRRASGLRWTSVSYMQETAGIDRVSRRSPHTLEVRVHASSSLFSRLHACLPKKSPGSGSSVTFGKIMKPM